MTAAGRRADAALGRRNAVLAGFMGTGKSTVGRLAADAMGRPFADVDQAVEAAAGATIADIFAREGEAGFRAREARAVTLLAAGARQVLATGGGALGSAENIAALRAGGLLVTLRARPDVILRRVGGASGAAVRPMLAGPDALARIEELLAARAAAYAQADVELDTSLLSPEEAVESLLRLVSAAAR